MVLRGDQFHLKGGIRDDQGCGVAIQPRLQLLGTAVVVAMEGQVVVAVSASVVVLFPCIVLLHELPPAHGLFGLMLLEMANKERHFQQLMQLRPGKGEGTE